MPSEAKRFKGLKGDYLLLARLGQGSSSEIRLATQLEVAGPERFLIYKQLKSQLAANEGQTKRFIREARIASILSHDGLPRILETGKIKDSYFVIQEFLLGDSLGTLLTLAQEAGLVVTPRLAASLSVQVCDALAHLHTLQSAKGEDLHLLHRNVNLKTLVVKADGRVKLTNMNLRRKDDLPHPSNSMGHQSPELASGLPTGSATDIFSLGVVLWEMLTGRHLFQYDSRLDTKMAVTECQVRSPREIRSNLPARLEQVVLRALQKEPEERFSSAEEMGKALRGFLGEATDVSILEEVRQFSDRVASDRFRSKAAMLEDIEAGRIEEFDPELLLPGQDSSLLPAGQEPEPEPEPEVEELAEAPAEESEPLPKPDAVEPPVEEKQEAVGEPDQPREKSQPGPVDRWIQLLRERDLMTIATTAGVAIVLLLILIVAWPSGDEDADETGASEDTAQASSAEADGPAEDAPAAVEETPAPKASARPEMARLEIITDPKGCVVKLDALQLSGVTPLKNVIVPANIEYRVEVSCRGYEVDSRQVTPQPDQDVPMEFYPPEKGDQVKRYGRLQLSTRPKTVVYLGKRRLGTTPLKGVKLPAGTHKIRLVNKKKRINKKLEIAIEPGMTTKLRPKL